MGGYVGVFYVLDDSGFVLNKTELSKAENYAFMKTCKVSHLSLWNCYIKGNGFSYKDLPYDYFPRGRVVYDVQELEFIIYLDKCVNRKEVIRKIIKNFGIDNKQYRIIDDDEHYKCKVCNNGFMI